MTDHLAVVGGGPSVRGFVAELQDFDGEVWAVNGAHLWARSRGINCAFYTIDPSEACVGYAQGATRAVLADTVSPKVFQALKGVPKILAKLDGLPHGTTTASTALALSIVAGHKTVTFYGCESSADEQTHAYQDSDWDLVRVECGGETYLTCPQMIMQVELMAETIRALPDRYKVKGGGFLPALVEHGDYEVVEVSRNIMERVHAAVG